MDDSVESEGGEGEDPATKLAGAAFREYISQTAADTPVYTGLRLQGP